MQAFMVNPMYTAWVDGHCKLRMVYDNASSMELDSKIPVLDFVLFLWASAT